MVHHSLVFMLSVNDCYRRLVLHNLITGRGVSRFFSILNDDDNLWQPISSMLSTAFVLSLLLSQISNGMFNTFVNFSQISIFVDMSLFFLADLCVNGYQWVLFLLKIDKENIDIVSYCRHTVEDWPHGYNGTDLNWTNVKSKK